MISSLIPPKQDISRERLHVLTITPFYPSIENEGNGSFVAEPLPVLEELGIIHSVRVVQPFYRTTVHATNAAVSAQRLRYFVFPGNAGLASSGRFLFGSITSNIQSLNRKNPINLIHAHGPLPCGHAAALLAEKLKIPLVVTVHGLDAFSTNQVAGPSGKRCAQVCQQVYERASRVICISEKVRDQVILGAHLSAKATVVYNGVDPVIFAPSPGNQSSSILSVGNLIPIKGHEILLRALGAIQDRFPEISCDIIGEGTDLSHLAKIVKVLNISDKVRFLGRQNRRSVAHEMGKCALFALPSKYEGLGCVYLEAMASGKTVIGCRGQGIDEVIEHGVNGWLVDPDDIQGLTELLSILLQDEKLRHCIGTAARQTILGGYTLAHQAQRLAQIYRECRS